jgi:NSS family neurotransmitter:Na+ symporter
LLLIPIQAIIFAWIYGLDNIIPVLNEHSTFKVGRVWKIIVKYISPLILFALWLVGLFDLFKGANSFEISIYVSIMASVLILAFYLSRKKSPDDI